MDRILFIIVGGTLGYLYSIIRDLQKEVALLRKQIAEGDRQP